MHARNNTIWVKEEECGLEIVRTHAAVEEQARCHSTFLRLLCLLTAQMTSHNEHLQAFLAERDHSEPVEVENRRGSHAGADVVVLVAVQHEGAAAVGAGERVCRHAKCLLRYL